MPRKSWADRRDFHSISEPHVADRKRMGRAMARRDPVGIRLITRGGKDWTTRFSLIVEAANRLKVRSCLIDGEAVCCDENGLAVFHVLRVCGEITCSFDKQNHRMVSMCADEEPAMLPETTRRTRLRIFCGSPSADGFPQFLLIRLGSSSIRPERSRRNTSGCLATAP